MNKFTRMIRLLEANKKCDNRELRIRNIGYEQGYTDGYKFIVKGARHGSPWCESALKYYNFGSIRVPWEKI